MPSIRNALTNPTGGGARWEHSGGPNFYYPAASTRPHIHIIVNDPESEFVGNVYSSVSMMAVSSIDTRLALGVAGGSGITACDGGVNLPARVGPARARLQNSPFLTIATVAGSGSSSSDQWRRQTPSTITYTPLNVNADFRNDMIAVFNAVYLAP